MDHHRGIKDSIRPDAGSNAGHSTAMCLQEISHRDAFDYPPWDHPHLLDINLNRSTCIGGGCRMGMGMKHIGAYKLEYLRGK
jgi:hypothetical protein